MGKCFTIHRCPTSWSYVWTIGCRCDSPSILHQTENPNNILGTFSTISSLDKGTPESRKAATINGFIHEFAGSFVLFFGALGLTKHFFGAEVAGLAQKAAAEQGRRL